MVAARDAANRERGGAAFSQLSMNTVERFQKMNWGEERRAIHELAVGQEIYFSVKGHNNTHNHVRRLNDAYQGRRAWTLSRRDDVRVVARIK